MVKTHLNFILILLLIFISVFNNLNAETAEKVAIVDTKLVLKKYSKAQKVLEDIAKAEEKLRKKLQAKRLQLQDARAAKNTETEIQLLTQQIKNELEPEAAKLEKDSAAKSKAIEDEVKASIEQIKRKNKYSIVMIKDAVLFGGVDITDEVLKNLEGSKQ